MTFNSVADANGEAEYRGEVEGCPLSATELVHTVIYYADGRTYRALPNRGEFCH